MTIDKIQFSNAAYVEYIKRATYNMVPILAIQRRGGLSGCWEQLIGEMLQQHCALQNMAAYTTMEELGFENFTEGCWTMAGEMIINNEQIEV